MTVPNYFEAPVHFLQPILDQLSHQPTGRFPLVGVLENLMGAYVIGTELKLAVALLLIVGVLTLKPSGVFGRVVVTRV